MSRFRPFFMLAIAVLLAGCNLPKYQASLAYEHEADILVVYAKAYTAPAGGFNDLPYCNETPALAIWGDGRVIADAESGNISPDQVTSLISFIQSQGLLSSPTDAVNPAGTGLEMVIALKSGAHRIFLEPNPPVYTEILARLKPYLKPYQPEEGLLLAAPYTHSQADEMLPADIPDWPASVIGFSLSEVPADGRVVSGRTAAFVWQAIHESPLVTRFRDGDKVYAVSLEVPGFLDPRRQDRCW